MGPGADAAGTTAKASAELQRQLADLSLPAIKEALGQWGADLGTPGQEPSSIRRAYGQARASLREDFAGNEEVAAATLKQQALQSGGNANPGAVNEAMGLLGQRLASSEGQQMRALNFQEAQAGLNQTNSLLSNITGASGNLLSGSFRFGGQALQADQLLAQYQQQQSQQYSTYGALAGSILGTIAYPGIGTAIGGALGGAAGGYFGSQ